MKPETGESVAYKITRVLAGTTERLTHAEIVAAVGPKFAPQIASNLCNMRKAGRLTRTHVPSKGVKWTYQLRRRSDVKNILTPEDLAVARTKESTGGTVVVIPVGEGKTISLAPAEARAIYQQLKQMYR